MAIKWNTKMSEAFGRAMNSRMGKDGKAAKAINNSEIASKANTPYLYKDKDIDAINAYRKGQAEGTENFYVGRERANAQAARNMDPTAKRIWENYDFDYERAYGPDGAYQRAVELSGVDDAPSTKEEFFDRFGFEVSESPAARPSNISREISNVEDVNSDARLQKDMEQAFDEAAERHGYDRWRAEAANKPVDDGLGGELHNVERELTEDEVRAKMIEDLQKGANILDILDFGKAWSGR